MVQPLWRALQLFTAFILFALMVITVLDVVGRYFLNAPLAGAFELTKLSMGLLVFSALPLVTARERHIVVGMFEPILAATARRRAVQQGAVNAIAMVIMGFMAWQMWRYAFDQAGSGLTTPSLLLPMEPFAFYMAAMAVVTTLVFVAVLVAHVTYHRVVLLPRPHDPGETPRPSSG